MWCMIWVYTVYQVLFGTLGINRFYYSISQKEISNYPDFMIIPFQLVKSNYFSDVLHVRFEKDQNHVRNVIIWFMQI